MGGGRYWCQWWEDSEGLIPALDALTWHPGTGALCCFSGAQEGSILVFWSGSQLLLVFLSWLGVVVLRSGAGVGSMYPVN